MEDTSSSTRTTYTDRFFAWLEQRRPSDRTLISFLILICIGAGVWSLKNLNESLIETVPATGGVLKEGIIGTPRFINPVLAITKSDHDLVALTYSGLMKLDATGALAPDLAESVTVSEDGLVYNVVLRQGMTFHDGTPVQASDVAFTIERIQEPDLKSPLRGNWSGVAVEVLGTHELNFVLTAPYTPFMENLTVGILPAAIWGSLTVEQMPFSQYNTEPIGTGMYKVSDIKRTDAGLIEQYTLEAVLGNTTPNIETVEFHFFQSEDGLQTALTEGSITSAAGLSYETIAALDTDVFTVNAMPLPRVFSVFFNQNKSAVLLDPAVRDALATAIDRQALIDEVIAGYGSPTDSPIPPGFLALESEGSTTTDPDDSLDRVTEARSILETAGWELRDNVWVKEIDEEDIPLTFTIATANTPLFAATAEQLQAAWEAIGVSVQVDLYEQNDLVQSVIRPRDYQALLFGTDVGRPLDFYPFWHSSQREDPGLNVALYTNITTDAALETMRTSRDPITVASAQSTFIDEIASDQPAIFLYSPAHLYVFDATLKVTPSGRHDKSSERFTTIAEWYMAETEVWPVFNN